MRNLCGSRISNQIQKNKTPEHDNSVLLTVETITPVVSLFNSMQKGAFVAIQRMWWKAFSHFLFYACLPPRALGFKQAHQTKLSCTASFTLLLCLECHSMILWSRSSTLLLSKGRPAISLHPLHPPLHQLHHHCQGGIGGRARRRRRAGKMLRRSFIPS